MGLGLAIDEIHLDFRVLINRFHLTENMAIFKELSLTTPSLGRVGSKCRWALFMCTFVKAVIERFDLIPNMAMLGG